MKSLLLLPFLCALSLAAPAQIITTIAGTGDWSCSGDGGPATAASVGQLYSTTTDTAGNVYITCTTCRKVKKITPAGIITTVLGNGVGGSTGDGGPATAATIGTPWGLAIDRTGNLYVADWENSVIRKVNTAGIISTIAGDASILGGGYSGDGGPATAALLAGPAGISLDTAGNLYIAEEDNNVIRKISTTGIISRVAGNGTYALSGDGGPAMSAGVQAPTGVTADDMGNLYIIDKDNQRVRKVSAAGIITTVAGNGTPGFSGNGGAATAAQLHFPETVAADRSGNIYIAESGNNVVRKVDGAGIISAFAGDGTLGHSGDGGVASAAQLNAPMGIAIDKSGAIYIAELNGAYLRKIDTCRVPYIAPISGATVVCTGMTTMLTNATAGGVWSVADTAVATIDTTGLVTAAHHGSVIVRYSVTNSCATESVTDTVTFGANAGTLTGVSTYPPFHTIGSDTFCFALQLTTNGSPGGVWGLTDSTAAMYTSPGRIVPIFINHPDTAYYAYTNACGTDTAFFPFVIVICEGGVPPAPSAGVAVHLYPNPATTLLNVNSPEKIEHITITDLLGRSVYSQDHNSENIAINIADLPEGMYLVMVDNAPVQKFVKQ